MRTLIKNTFSDIFLLFRNFIHWNISKVIIFILSFVIGLISAIPLLAIYFIFTGFSVADLLVLINSVFISGQALTGIFSNIIYFLFVIFFTIGYFYYYILLEKLYLSYLSGDKNNIKGSFFKKVKKYLQEQVVDVFKNYKIFFKYFGLALIFGIILILPFLFFGVLSLIIVGVMGGVTEVTNIVLAGPNNIFTLLFGLFLILAVLVSAYLGYRFIFSFLLLLEEKNKEKGIFSLLKKSFSLTKSFKKLLKLFSAAVVLFIALLPLNIIGGLLSMKNAELTNYIYYSSQDDAGKSKLLIGNNSSYYNGLKIKYNEVELKNVLSDKSKSDLYLGIFSIFQFMVMNGLFFMLLASFYKRIIIKK